MIIELVRRLRVAEEEEGEGSGDESSESRPFLEPRLLSDEHRDWQSGLPGPNGERDSRRRGNISRGETEMAPLLK